MPAHLFAVALLVLFSAGCGLVEDAVTDAIDDTTDGLAAVTEATTNDSDGLHLFADPDAVDAQTYFDAIIASGYRDFATAPGYDDIQPSAAPHGGNVKIYLNPVMATAITSSGLGAWPDGALIVKDGFRDDGTHALIATMEKYEGRWFYAEFTPAGAVIAGVAFEPASCTRCHDPATNDQTLAFPLP